MSHCISENNVSSFGKTKKHITLSVPEEDILKVKIYAMKKNTNVSRLFHEWVQKHCSEPV